jgi:hypothetical protein
MNFQVTIMAHKMMAFFIIIIIIIFLDNEGFLVEGAALVKGMTWIEICFFF